MDPLGRFLVEVGERLPLPPEVREEVLEELAAHLSDATAELVRNGRDPAAAEREAIVRLGSRRRSRVNWRAPGRGHV